MKKNSDWRQIHQQLFSPAITPVAHRRRRFATLKRLGLIFGSLTLILGLVGTVIYLKKHSATFAPYAEQNHKTQIAFFSDGQLGSAYFKKHFPNLQTKGLLTIDIAKVQSKLLNNPQILSATVEREFPSTLKVTLRERKPLARIKLKLNKKVDTFYLGADGAFFTSKNYQAPNTLPYIQNANLKLKDGQIAPISAATAIGQIVDGIQSRLGVYNGLVKSIDLGSWEFPIKPTTALTIHLRNGATLRFSPTNIDAQINRLSEVVTLLEQERENISNKLIDLTYPDKVAIVGLP